MDEKTSSNHDRIRSLAQLYLRDPEQFEVLSRRMIAETIDTFPPETRAKANGLQLRIDAELGHFKDPVARMNRMVEIFWEGVERFRRVMDDPDQVLRSQRESRGEPARVIPFPGRKDALH